MGTTAGTLSWTPYWNDKKFLQTFEQWAREDGITYNSVYCSFKPGKTQFTVDSSGFSRNSQRIQRFMRRCRSALEMHDVKCVLVIKELPM
jgi:hypothetical protein